MYKVPHADTRAAILAAAESGALKKALERWDLKNLAIQFVRDNPGSATRTVGINFDQYHRFMKVWETLGITHPHKFRRSDAEGKYTITTGIGYDTVEFDWLGGTGDGDTRKAWRDAGLVVDL